MNPARCTATDDLDVLVATPRSVSFVEAARVQPSQEDCHAHPDAFTPPFLRAAQTFAFNNLGVVMVSSIQGLTQTQAQQHLQALHTGAIWDVDGPSGLLVFNPSLASCIPTLQGQFATQSDPNGAYAYQVFGTQRAPDGTYLGVQLRGSLYTQDGHSYLSIDEQIATAGAAGAPLQPQAELQYVIAVAVEPT